MFFRLRVVSAEHVQAGGPSLRADPEPLEVARLDYVTFLTAAAVHGASHQAPQTFQVAVSKATGDVDIERIKLRFCLSEAVSWAATDRVLSHTGHFVVGSKEMTAVDLTSRPRECGGLNNVATTLAGLSDLDAEQLARLAPRHDRATARRLGWLLERYYPGDLDLHWLQVVSQPADGEPTLLAASGPKRGRLDKTWGIRQNTTIDSDL